jgi:hypothetical protein
MEMLLSDSIIWLWGLDWSINSEDLTKHFTQAGRSGVKICFTTVLYVPLFFSRGTSEDTVHMST